jgi:hypothetical protein
MTKRQVSNRFGNNKNGVSHETKFGNNKKHLNKKTGF